MSDMGLRAELDSAHDSVVAELHVPGEAIDSCASEIRPTIPFKTPGGVNS